MKMIYALAAAMMLTAPAPAQTTTMTGTAVNGTVASSSGGMSAIGSANTLNSAFCPGLNCTLGTSTNTAAAGGAVSAPTALNPPSGGLLGCGSFLASCTSVNGTANPVFSASTNFSSAAAVPPAVLSTPGNSAAGTVGTTAVVPPALFGTGMTLGSATTAPLTASPGLSGTTSTNSFAGSMVTSPATTVPSGPVTGTAVTGP